MPWHAATVGVSFHQGSLIESAPVEAGLEFSHGHTPHARPKFGAPPLAHLDELTADASALQEFRHWFSNALWDVESGVDEASDDSTDLFYAVENLIGIYDAGFWTIDELVAALREEVDTRTLAPLTRA